MAYYKIAPHHSAKGLSFLRWVALNHPEIGALDTLSAEEVAALRAEYEAEQGTKL